MDKIYEMINETNCYEIRDYVENYIHNIKLKEKEQEIEQFKKALEENRDFLFGLFNGKKKVKLDLYDIFFDKGLLSYIGSNSYKYDIKSNYLTKKQKELLIDYLSIFCDFVGYKCVGEGNKYTLFEKNEEGKELTEHKTQMENNIDKVNEKIAKDNCYIFIDNYEICVNVNGKNIHTHYGKYTTSQKKLLSFVEQAKIAYQEGKDIIC